MKSGFVAAFALVFCAVCAQSAPVRKMAPEALRTSITPMEYGTEGDDFLKAGLFVQPLVVEICGDKPRETAVKRHFEH